MLVRGRDADCIAAGDDPAFVMSLSAMFPIRKIEDFLSPKRFHRGFRLVFARAFLSPTGITGCSHGILRSLTWLFPAC
jgi:hypothetical protein